MTLQRVRLALKFAILSMAFAGCGSDQGGSAGDVGDVDAGAGDCSQPNFPSDQPDIAALTPPRFVTATGETQRVVAPGQEVRGEITVNAATRQVSVELRHSWFTDSVAATASLETSGNETISVSFFPSVDVRGRFYMRLTLCGLDCDEREVLFDIIQPDPDNQFETGINANYERTLFENGDMIQADLTCVRPNSILIQ